MNLRVFGDSYSSEFSYPTNHANWIYYKSISEQLELKLHNFSVPGSSLGYTYCKFNEADIQDNDYVIITLTSLDRRYFFYDRPQITDYRCFLGMMYDIDCHAVPFTQEEQDAVKQYMLYLDKNSELEKVNLINFLHTVDSIAIRKNLKVVVLCGFDETSKCVSTLSLPNIVIATGYLSHISMYECCDEYVFNKICEHEQRHCHMTRTNHEILTNKILYAFETKKSFDVAKDAAVGIITRQVLEDKNHFEFLNRYQD